MIDAVLFAARDAIRAAGLGYGVAECEIMEDGRPQANVGNLFVAVHETSSRSTGRNNLDEYVGFAVTLTMRVVVPQARIGDQLLASKLARVRGPGQPSFNARMEQLRALLHMNWQAFVQTGQTPSSANDNLVAWALSASLYGFVEPPQYVGRDKPDLVRGDWFSAEPDTALGIKCELRFDRCRRLQPQTAAIGPFE